MPEGIAFFIKSPMKRYKHTIKEKFMHLCIHIKYIIMR